MRRTLVGIIAVLLFAGAVYFQVYPPEGAFWVQLKSACWRVGALMAVIWLAYPEVARLPAWLIGTVPVLAVFLALRPKLFLIAVPIVIALAILKPKAPRQR